MMMSGKVQGDGQLNDILQLSGHGGSLVRLYDEFGFILFNCVNNDP